MFRRLLQATIVTRCVVAITDRDWKWLSCNKSEPSQGAMLLPTVILIMVDLFPWWPEVLPVPDQQAITVARTFLDVSSDYVLLWITSDQGRHFEWRLFEELIKLVRPIDETAQRRRMPLAVWTHSSRCNEIPLTYLAAWHEADAVQFFLLTVTSVDSGRVIFLKEFEYTLYFTFEYANRQYVRRTGKRRSFVFWQAHRNETAASAAAIFQARNFIFALGFPRSFGNCKNAMENIIKGVFISPLVFGGRPLQSM